MNSLLITILKILTSIVIVALVLLLGTKKEITQKISFNKNRPSTIHIAEILTPELEKKTTSAPNNSETKNPQEQPQDLIPPTPTVQEDTQKPAIIEKVQTPSQYIPMQEGQSDTDESYQPSISPCNIAMGYKIGRFDTNFGISKVKFIDEIDRAAALWGDEYGKRLFFYNENGPLTINLIYDERQARTESVNNLALEIQNAKESAEVLKNTYEQEKAIYIGDGEQLTKESEEFNARYKLYADKVALYNSQGGAPTDIYNEMSKELQTLKQMSQDLSTRRDALIQFMESINLKVKKYNEFVAYINSLIEQSNALGAKKFTEGRFSPRTNTIDIYQYNDLVKLRRVIAHELGHVIGINHTESMYSIMYAVNSDTSLALGNDDKIALTEVCPK